MYSGHLFLISSASVTSIPFLPFIVPIFAWKGPLVSHIFLKRSLVFPILLFLLFLCIAHWGRLSYLSLLFFGILYSDGCILPGESLGQRSLVSYIQPMGLQESDRTEWLNLTELKGKGEKERYTHLNAVFQRIARRDKKAFLSDQCKEIEENNRMGNTRDLFKKLRDTKGTFHAKTGTIKDCLCPWNFPGKNTGVLCHFLLQGIFPTQGSDLVSRTAGRFFIIWATRKAQEYWSG